MRAERMPQVRWSCAGFSIANRAHRPAARRWDTLQLVTLLLCSLLTDPGDTGGARHHNAIGSSVVVISSSDDEMDTAPLHAVPPAAAAPTAGALALSLVCIADAPCNPPIMIAGAGASRS